MKYLTIILSLTLCGSVLSCNTSKQSTSKSGTETIQMKVEGVCGMCKDRIETTVYNLPGVKTAEWVQESSMLTAVINPSKTSEEAIAKALAKVGHTSQFMVADQAAYDKLPGCCKYADGVEKH